MKLYTKLLKAELSAVNKISDICPFEKSRVVMDKLGAALALRYGSGTDYADIDSADFHAKYIIPHAIKHEGMILYLHGGGYILGGMDYAKGVGTLLAVQTGIKVCCLAYRLAPEHKFPAAVSDAYNAYLFLLQSGYPPEKLILCGESAGGGLIYSLALCLKANGSPLPRGMIAISPWSDLTLSGSSYEENSCKDPSMTQKRLRLYAENYTDQLSNPYVSPLFGDLEGLPPSLILAGGHEIMLSDSVALHKKLISCGCSSTLDIAPEMWHVYLMHNIAEAKVGYQKINIFLEAVFNEKE